MTLLILVSLASAAAPAMDVKPGTPFSAPAVSVTTLGTMTGQADVAQDIRATNTGTVANNQVNGDSVTGKISFDSSAFANMHGLSVLSANTGNNVAINSSLNVNVSIRP